MPPTAELVRAHTLTLQRNNLKEDVAAYIRERIFAGDLRPGMKLDQDGIAETLGISKLPVREALIVLEAEGLVDSLPRRGAFVARLTAEDIYDQYHIYSLLVAVATERAAARITDEELDELEELLERMDRWDARAPAEEQDALGEEFHRIIFRAGGSRRLNSVLRSLSYGIPKRVYHQARGWTDVARKEHRDILDALRDRDGARAASAAVAHIESGAAHAVRMLKESGFWDE